MPRDEEIRRAAGKKGMRERPVTRQGGGNSGRNAQPGAGDEWEPAPVWLWPEEHVHALRGFIQQHQ